MTSHEMTPREPTTELLVGRDGPLGRLTLNRPAQLNAITLPMVRAMAAALDDWENDPEVAAVVLDGAGTRGLCAGGDVRFLYDDVARGGRAFPVLLAAEYRLDARVARYPKPYLALMDGVVMGGGVGVSAHGSVRVVTERTTLAMPEVSIGYVPDVGGTWLLARAPGELGTHVALSGARLSGAEAIACGLADVLVPSGRLPDLVGALATALAATTAATGRSAPGAAADTAAAGTAGTTTAGAAAARAVGEERGRRTGCAGSAVGAPAVGPRPVRAHAGDAGVRAVRAVTDGFTVDPGQPGLLADRGWIDECYSADTVPEILARLRAAGRDPTADAIEAQSPVALVLTLQALRAARRMTLEQALAQEYALTRAAVRWPDFAEGVRARLLDRGGTPRWTPPTLDEVTDEVVAAFLGGARPDDPPLDLARRRRGAARSGAAHPVDPDARSGTR
jgi:enoyl-CoA hydratase